MYVQAIVKNVQQLRWPGHAHDNSLSHWNVILSMFKNNVLLLSFLKPRVLIRVHVL